MAKIDYLPFPLHVTVCAFVVLRGFVHEATDDLERVRWSELAQAKRIQYRHMRG
jgi:hypothetical protein